MVLGYEGAHDMGYQRAAIAQLGERTTEDRKVPGSKPGFGTSFAPAYFFEIREIICEGVYLYFNQTINQYSLYLSTLNIVEFISNIKISRIIPMGFWGFGVLGLGLGLGLGVRG